MDETKKHILECPRVYHPWLYVCTCTVLSFLIYLNDPLPNPLEAKRDRHMCTGRLCTGFGKEKKKRRATVSVKTPAL